MSLQVDSLGTQKSTSLSKNLGITLADRPIARLDENIYSSLVKMMIAPSANVLIF
jgi:hypothetical protein